MGFPDHPLTIAWEEIRADVPVKCAQDAISLLQAIRRGNSSRLVDGTDAAIERLITFLSSTRKMHQVNCTHEDLKWNGVVYRCAKCRVAVLK